MKIPVFLLMALPFCLQAAENLALPDIGNDTKTATSPQNRVAVLELYTSEGCSSCPPADHFLSGLKTSGISDRQLIPMAFHVTYWDYIGWQDRFADRRYDQRQRQLAHKRNTSTVYTPQFVLSGEDYRRYANFSRDVGDIVRQKASVDLALTVSSEHSVTQERLAVTIRADAAKSSVKKLAVYLVVLEDDLSSKVDDGENEGETLYHDSVVRQLSGPYRLASDEKILEQQLAVTLRPEWKNKDLSIVAFAEDSETGEVLQAVSLGLD